MISITKSSTLSYKPSPLTAYASNPSSTRVAADQRGGYVRRPNPPNSRSGGRGVHHARSILETGGGMLIRGLLES